MAQAEPPLYAPLIEQETIEGRSVESESILEPDSQQNEALYDSNNNDENVSDDTTNSDNNDMFLLQDSQERSLVADLFSHLNDDEISDIMLVGTDGETVLGIKSILAMRSPFFRKLFYSSFQESSSTRVQLGYSSKVLKAVVEYCYTDEIKTAFENLSFEETARSMVGLIAAGHYFALKGLQSRAYKLTCIMMDEYPALSCAVLEETTLHNETSELKRVALGIIRLRAESALLPPDTYGLGVQSLGRAAMEQVMSDTEIQTSELSLFMCLKKWAEYDPPASSLLSSSSLQSSQQGPLSGEERAQAARTMASYIDFSKIVPSVLSTTIQESNLVPMELLLMAYRTQALLAERKGLLNNASNGQMRSTTTTTSTLQEQEQASLSSGSIMIQGAGLAACNGTFTSCNEPNDPLRYSRQGSLPGFGSGTFYCSQFLMNDDSKKWFLSFTQDDNDDSMSTSSPSVTLDLYSAPVLSDTDPPPMQKWLSIAQGHERIRQVVQDRFPAASRRQHESSSGDGDGSCVGDPPPICIWLPNESSSSSHRRGSSDQ